MTRYRHGDRVLEVIPGLLEREQAQKDLDTYADVKDLEEVE